MTRLSGPPSSAPPFQPTPTPASLSSVVPPLDNIARLISTPDAALAAGSNHSVRLNAGAIAPKTVRQFLKRHWVWVASVSFVLGLSAVLLMLINRSAKDVGMTQDFQPVAELDAPTPYESPLLQQAESERMLSQQAGAMEQALNSLRYSVVYEFRHCLMLRARDWQTYAGNEVQNLGVSDPALVLHQLPISQMAKAKQAVQAPTVPLETTPRCKQVEKLAIDLLAIQLATNGDLPELGIDSLPDTTQPVSADPERILQAIQTYRDEVSQWLTTQPGGRQLVLPDLDLQVPASN